MANPIVTIEMENGGIIKLELYPEAAPETVHNFISLVRSKFYDGLAFHRVVTDFCIQAGDPAGGQGVGGPGYCIKGEFPMNGFQNPLKHVRGTVSMSRRNPPNSAGSQFFILTKDQTPYFDVQYAAFGRVMEGMDVVDRIASVDSGYNDRPKHPEIMKKVSVETFGTEYPEPHKLEEML